MKNDNMKARILNIMLILVFCFLYCTMEAMQGISAFAVSIVLGVSATKHHYTFFAAESVLTIVLISLFGSIAGDFEGFAVGFTEAVIMILLGTSLGICVNTKKSALFTVIMCSAVYLASTLIGFFTGLDASSFEIILEDTKAVITQIITTQYGNSKEMMDLANSTMSEMLTLTYKLMPATFVCMSFLSALILTFVFKKVLVMIKSEKMIYSLSMMRGDKLAAIVFIIVAIMSFSAQTPMMADVLLNILVILIFAFFLFGVSYINFSMKLRRTNNLYRRLVVGVVIPLVTIMFVFPGLLLAGVGFIDCFKDFRKKAVFKEGGNGSE